MILDEFGKPVRGSNTFCASDWLTKRGIAAMSGEWEAQRRIRELRNSLEFARLSDAPLVGQTVKVRLPKRFERLQSPDQVCSTESPT